MNIDQRILDSVLDMTSSCPGFYEAFIKELETHGEGVNFHLADFDKVKAKGWCSGSKDIYISHVASEDNAPFLFMLFLLLHESMHINHSWSESCKMDYQGFKESTLKNEKEANDYALGVLEKLKSIGFSAELKQLIFVVNMQINQANFQFDNSHKSLYENYGASLCLEHIGKII